MKIKKLISVYFSICNCTGKNVLVNVVIQNDARPYRDSTTFVSMSFTDVCRLIAYVIFSPYGDTSVIISKQNQDPSLKRARLMSVILQWWWSLYCTTLTGRISPLELVQYKSGISFRIHCDSQCIWITLFLWLQRTILQFKLISIACFF